MLIFILLYLLPSTKHSTLIQLTLHPAPMPFRQSVCRVQNLISGYQELSDSLTAIANAHPDQTALVQAINGLNVQIQQAIDQQTQIKNKLDEIAAALPSATADASTLKKELDDLLAREQLLSTR